MNYVLIYSEGLDPSQDIEIFADTTPCSSTTFPNTTCADNLLGKTLTLVYTHPKHARGPRHLCEVIIAGVSGDEYKCTDGYGKEDGYCTPCTAGQYKGRGMTQCTACPPDTFSDHEAAVECTVCPLMSYAKTGSTHCTLCTPESTQRECYGYEGKENVLEGSEPSISADEIYNLRNVSNQLKFCYQLKRSNFTFGGYKSLGKVAVVYDFNHFPLIEPAIRIGNTQCIMEDSWRLPYLALQVVYECSSYPPQGYKQLTIEQSFFTLCNLFVFGVDFSTIEAGPGNK